jgi:hypothetical protein
VTQQALFWSRTFLPGTFKRISNLRMKNFFKPRSYGYPVSSVCQLALAVLVIRCRLPLQWVPCYLLLPLVGGMMWPNCSVVYDIEGLGELTLQELADHVA